MHFNTNISKLVDSFIDKNPNNKIADLIIGATAKHNQMPLYTLNKKDFKFFDIELI